MKVLFVVTKSEVGGAQTHVYQMARALLARGYTPHIMSRPGGWLEKVVAEQRIPFHSNPHFSNRINIVADIRAGISLLKLVAQIEPDLVSCHSSKAGIITRFTLRGGIPTIFTAHGWGFFERSALSRKLLFVPCEKLAGRYATKVICVSRYVYTVARQLNIVPESRLAVVPNGVEPAAGRRPRRIDDGTVRILFVGRLVSQKDPETLLRAYAELPGPVRENTQLRIVGEGMKASSLGQLIRTHGLSDRVQLLGRADRQVVFNELRNSDIFALTTHYEGLPRTVIEAMHMGLPIIATDVCGVRETMADNDSNDHARPIGVLVRWRNVQDVRLALERLIGDVDLRRSMGQAARIRARRKFSQERMVRATIRVYEDALESHRLGV